MWNKTISRLSTFHPSDDKVYPMAELCQKYNKPLVFHSGDVYDFERKAALKYSHPIHIDDLAVKFPKCKIVIAHFGFPYHIEAANIVSKNENVYTEISGTIDKPDSNKESENLLNQYAKDLQRVFSYFPEVKAKTMFGTDYGGEHTPLNQVEPYIELVERVFLKSEQENVFHKLAEDLFFK
ncbi:MAG: amidohydrolase family protein [Thermodesulfobacteriota bacterium]